MYFRWIICASCIMNQNEDLLCIEIISFSLENPRSFFLVKHIRICTFMYVMSHGRLVTRVGYCGNLNWILFYFIENGWFYFILICISTVISFTVKITHLFLVSCTTVVDGNLKSCTKFPWNVSLYLQSCYSNPVMYTLLRIFMSRRQISCMHISTQQTGYHIYILWRTFQTNFLFTCSLSMLKGSIKIGAYCIKTSRVCQIKSYDIKTRYLGQRCFKFSTCSILHLLKWNLEFWSQ